MMRFFRFFSLFSVLFCLLGCGTLGSYAPSPRSMPTAAELDSARDAWGGAGKVWRSSAALPKRLDNPKIVTLPVSSGFPLFGQKSGPLAVGGLVIVAGSDGNVTAIDRKSREVVWTFKSRAGIYSTPAAGFGKIIVADEEGNINALDPSGKSVWNVSLPYPVFADLLVSGDYLYVLTADQKLYSFRAEDGVPLWQYGDRMPRESAIWKGTSFAAWKSSVYLGTSEGYLVKIDSESGAALWKVKIADKGLFPDVTAGPSIEDGIVYAGAKDGTVAALNADTGSILWKTNGGGATGFALSKDALYYGSFKGEIISVKKSGGEEIWRISPSRREESPSFVVLAGNEILAGYHESGIYALDAATGKPRGSYSTGSGVGAPPFVDEKGTVIHSNAGNLYLFDSGE